jgi:RNA polymerase sigma-70 factor, ECF subfamily
MAKTSMPASWRPDDDASLAVRIANRDPAAFEIVMRRYNGRLFRIARAILKDDPAAEDALQEAYLDAFRRRARRRARSRRASPIRRLPRSS